MALRQQAGIILSELLSAQGAAQNIGGYYLPDPEKVYKAMRPSGEFNTLLEGLT
jgi:isocitrate dehydrogenase